MRCRLSSPSSLNYGKATPISAILSLSAYSLVRPSDDDRGRETSNVKLKPSSILQCIIGRLQGTSAHVIVERRSPRVLQLSHSRLQLLSHLSTRGSCIN